MKKEILKFVFVFFSVLAVQTVYGQCDTIAKVSAGKYLSGKSKFISDGQEYRALLIDNEIAEFNTAFYGGSTYRIVAWTGLNEGNLLFRVFDSEHHLLFSNSDYKNAAYWDFKFKSTVNCTIEAQLLHSNGTTGASSGCAVVLIGFKNN
jgi:hypothetical protein